MQTLVAIAADATCDGISSSVFTALDNLIPSTSSLADLSNNSSAIGSSAVATVGDVSVGSGSSSSSSSSGAGGDSDSVTAGSTTLAASGGGPQTSVAHHLYGRLLVHVQALLKIQANYYGVVGDRVLTGIGSFLCRLLESGAGKQALRSHFQTSPHFCSVLLSPIPPKSTAIKLAIPSTKPNKDSGKSKASTSASEKTEDKPEPTSKAVPSTTETDVDTNALPKPVVDFLNTLFQVAEKNPKDADLSGICGHIWSWVDSGALQRWLTSALMLSHNPPSSPEPSTPAPTTAGVVPTPGADMPPASSFVGFIRKRKEHRNNSFIGNPFANPTSSSASSKSKLNEAVVLDEDDLSLDVGDVIKDPEAMVDGLRLVLRLRDSWKLLRAMAGFVCSQDSDVAKQQCVSLLRSLETVGNSIVENGEGSDRLEPITCLLPIMTSLAAGAGPMGHLSLFKTTTHWLELCKTVVLETPSGEDKNLFPLHQLLEYMSDILVAVKLSGELNKGVTSTEILPEVSVAEDSDWLDDQKDDDDEETAQEDSDEDSLYNKLCTFTLTQKEFVNQHWYHCHSCQMEDGVGVCSVCAKVCHKGHDITYAKYGSFFCDCGAKEDGSCQALVKRHPTYKSSAGASAGPPSGFCADPLLRRARGPRALTPSNDKTREVATKHRRILSTQLGNKQSCLKMPLITILCYSNELSFPEIKNRIQYLYRCSVITFCAFSTKRYFFFNLWK